MFQFQSELDSVLDRPLFFSWLHPSFFSPASLPFAAAPRLGLRCSSSARTEVIRPEVQFNCHSVRSTPGAADGGNSLSSFRGNTSTSVSTSFFPPFFPRFVVVVAAVVVLFLLIVLFFFCLFICLPWLHQAFFVFVLFVFVFSVTNSCILVRCALRFLCRWQAP